jgi:hypothetical protein
MAPRALNELTNARFASWEPHSATGGGGIMNRSLIAES